MATHHPDYDPAAVESRWQTFWEQNRTFVAKDFDPRPKYFAMAMYPYPSGHGLHMGHSENYTATDVVSRYKRARGFNVLQPMGWDAFGLPTEQTAVQTGVHPREVTRRNVQTFTDQLNRHGFAIDWTREINTTDPGYVKWTQWIFLQLFKHGLAYVDERPVWWCPALGTVLANEEVIDGRSERGSHPVERRALRQWVLRITAYADKLLKRLDDVDWPETTRAKQRNWIGRSEGASIRFDLDGVDESLTVFTTRPDTLYGATYMVLAPEHPLVDQLTTKARRDQVTAYVRAAANKSDLERTDLAKDKSGVFTGSYAVNPATGQKIPVWVADYVLMGYGTGAIMAVPAHDQRDFEFAKKFNLPIIQVIEAPEGHSLENEAYTGEGRIINSGECNGLSVDKAKKKIVQTLEQQGRGSFSVNYKLRDWLFSRQRYWGEPFPIVWVSESDYAKAAGEVREFLPEQPVTYKQNGETLYAMPVPPSQLPLKLPETDNFHPAGNGESALARETDWVNIWYNLETGEGIPSTGQRPSSDLWVPARRETNTMPQWAGSCWYHLRYIDPHNDDHLVDPEKNNYWGSPDYYLGGPEHAVLHLLYAPFWHLFLYDIGAITTPEPYPKLVHQGMILGGNGEKMSKSRGNVVNPDSIISEYGADTLRLYLMFMGPLEDDKPWNDKGIEGIVRFLRRLWREVVNRDGALNPKISAEAKESRELQRAVHEAIRKVTEDYERGRYNTAISQLMICLSAIQKADQVGVASIKSFLQLLAPLAPHICEELWERLGQTGSIVDADWPKYDEKLLQVDEVALGLLVNGKPRGEVLTSREASQDAVLRLAMENEKVKPHLEGKTIRKVIYVPGKILNIVAN